GEVFATAQLVRAFGRERYEIEQFEVESVKHLEGRGGARLEVRGSSDTRHGTYQCFGFGYHGFLRCNFNH
ncbi:MAG: hypothetical protein ABL860_00405, partial [Candidatus Nitrotoga sp.]